ncbi:MAG: MalY/PatB family protein [Aristaeellaceae bacterium]
MRFNQEYFDEGLYRMGTRCEKWDECRAEHGEDALPMWVADMDFPSPPAVQEAILRRAAHPTYGYTAVMADDTLALTDFWQRRHGLTLDAQDVMMIPCVITGLKLAILALTRPGDGVIIQSPVYGPFRFSVEATGRTLMEAPLLRREDGGYDMDLAAVEAQLQAGAKMMLLCNPHNPVSRVWTKEELSALLSLLNRYGAALVSDEIHADFVYAPNTFTPVLSLQRERVISLCAASKTFNLAGLQQASLLCREEDVRRLIQAEMDRAGVRSGNIFALEATRAAYNEGDAWLDGLISYLDGSRALLQELVARHLPRAVLTPMEGTYLAWLDCRAYGMTTDELLVKAAEAGVVFTSGEFFGRGGEGYLRINIGCPRRYVEEGILRLAVALEG